MPKDYDKKNKGNKEKILQTALKRFENARDAESNLREKALEDTRFANDEQWDKQTEQEREGRPTLTVNKVAGTLKQIRGDQRQSRPQIKVRPVDSGADPELAKILNGLIKNIEYVSGADAAYDTAFDQAIEGGWGFFRIDTDYSGEDTFDQDLLIKRITNPFSVYIDPSYTEADACDIQWAFITETMEKDEFEAQYPDEEGSDWDSGMGEEYSDWWTKESIRVAEYFYKEPVKKKLYMLENGDTMDESMIEENSMEVKQFEVEGEKRNFIIFYDDETDDDGEAIPKGYAAVEKEREVKTYRVMWCKLTADKILEGPTEKPGKYIPIVLVAGEEAYINGKRHLKSAHRHARDAQKVYNWMVSTAVETVAMAPKQPFIATPEQIEGHEQQWNVAHRRPMPYLQYNHIEGLQPPSRQAGAVPDSGATQERMQAADDIKATTGIYDASLGAQGNEQSGRAIQARQMQGDISTFVFMDNLVRAMRHAGRILVDYIPYIYDGERIIRILGPDGTEQFAEINKTVMDPQSGQVQTMNDVTQGKYDVTIDTGPAYQTQRAEAAKQMLEFVKTMPQMAPMLIDLVAKNMDWPGADEIYERLQQIQQQQMGGEQQPDPQQQMDLQKAQAEIEKKKAEIAKDKMDIQGKQIEHAQDKQDLAIKADEADMKNEEHIMKLAQAAVQQVMQQMQPSGQGQSQQTNQAQQPANSPKRGA